MNEKISELIKNKYFIKKFNLEKIKNDYIIKTIDGKEYVLKKIDNNKIIQEKYENNNMLKAKKNEVILEAYNEKYYIYELHKFKSINNKSKYVNLESICYFLEKEQIKGRYINIDEIVFKWNNKLEYFENIVLNKNIINIDIITIFYYFIGMSEIALNYINNIYRYGNTIYVQKVHYRIAKELKNYELEDPNNYFEDNRIRDISEYLKKYVYIYNEEEIKNDLKKIKKLNLDKIEKIYLAGRMIFPTFFFDEFDNCLELNKSNILKIINLIDNYEKAIQKTIEYLNI